LRDHDAYTFIYARDDLHAAGVVYEVSDDEGPSPKRNRPSDGNDDDDDDDDRPFVPSDATDDEHDVFRDDKYPEADDEDDDDAPFMPSDPTRRTRMTVSEISPLPTRRIIRSDNTLGKIATRVRRSAEVEEIISAFNAQNARIDLLRTTC
jgi:hypothetical protein